MFCEMDLQSDFIIKLLMIMTTYIITYFIRYFASLQICFSITEQQFSHKYLFSKLQLSWRQTQHQL